MTGIELQILKIVRRFDASQGRLFDAWTNPKLAERWLFTGPTSQSHAVEFDVRVGGHWKITDRRDGVDYVALGEYRVIDPTRRLVFSFGMPQFSPEFAEVSVDFEPEGEGCRMTLTQDRMLPELIKPTEEGWLLMFDGLASALRA